MPASEGFKIISMELPIEINMTGSELLFYIYHLTKAFGLSNDEYNQYLDSISKKNQLSIDELYDRFLKGMSKMDIRMKRNELKEQKQNGDST